MHAATKLETGWQSLGGQHHGFHQGLYISPRKFANRGQGGWNLPFSLVDVEPNRLKARALSQDSFLKLQS